MSINIASITLMRFAVFIFFILSLVLVAYGPKPALLYVFLSILLALYLLWRADFGCNQDYVRVYLLFVFCLWVFSPFIRRFGDYFNGWSELNIYGMAPLLASLISVLFLNRGILFHRKFLIFLSLIVFVLFYAFIVGIFASTLITSLYATLTWVTPLAVFAYVVSNYFWYKGLVEEVRFASVVSVTILSVYGIYQYFYLPGWDAYWIINVPMTSVGLPFPTQFRVFSMSNSPMVYAPILAMMMILLATKITPFIALILLLATISISLTFVRATWVGLALSIVLYFLWLARHDVLQAAKLLFMLFFMLVSLTIILSGTEVGSVLIERVDTMLSLNDDTSFNARSEFYIEMFWYSVSNFFGDGMGSVGMSKRLSEGSNADTLFDSGVLQMFVVLGALGSILYAISMIFFLKRGVFNYLSESDPVKVALAVIVISMLAQLVFSNRLVGPIGFFLYFFWGLLIAGYYHDQEYSEEHERLDKIT